MTRSIHGLLGLVLGFGLGCSPHDVTHNPEAPVALPDSYGAEVPPDKDRTPPERWWREFQDPELNRLVEGTFESNFDLHGAWARLAQAEAGADIAGAPRYPTLDASLTGSHRRFPPQSSSNQAFQNTAMNVGGSSFQRDNTSNSVHGSLAASYEVDIWDKLGSVAKAAALDRDTARDAVQTLAMTLAAEVTETWFDLSRAGSRRAVLSRQLAVNETFLELVRLRFAQGQASAVDVNQQRQQVLATRSQLSLSTGNEQVLSHRLAVLLGKPPGQLKTEPSGALPALPPLPSRGVPSELLKRRPDVRAAQRSVEAADYRIAAAIADRYPSLRLTGSLSSEPSDINGWLFDPFWNLAAGLALPILDGGRRAAEVDRTKAVLAERVSSFGKTLLTAMLEVENALVLERQQAAHIEQIKQQSEVSRVTLTAARDRYSQGIGDFLTVLTVLTAQQQVELSLLDAERQLLSYRIQLCRALGGTWARELKPPKSDDGDREDET